MQSSRGHDIQQTGGALPDGVRAILDAVVRDPVDRAANRRRVDPNAVNPADLLPEDLAADDEATAVALVAASEQLNMWNNP